MSVAGQFVAASIRTATPLLLAAFGELIVERAGMINIGLEGAILAGAFGAVVGASSSGVAMGYLASAIGGLAMTMLFAVFVIRLRADQIITGTAVTLFSVGLTGTLYRTMFGESGIALGIPTSAPVRIPVLSALPVIGAGLFEQPMIAYATYALAALLALWMRTTHAALSLRAIGEAPNAAFAAGVRVHRLRLGALVAGGVLGGLAGGTLVLAQAGTFVENMSAGRGFIAIAIVVLGRWKPWGVAAAALLFGAASALQFLFQAMGWNAPYQLFLVVPYVLTLGGLAGAVGRARAPAALGKTI